MGIQFANRAATTLASAISSTGLTFTVAAGTGDEFPALGPGDYFYAALVNATGQTEYIKVVGRSGDAFTIEAGGRGVDGSTKRAFAVGDLVALRMCRSALLALRDDLAARSWWYRETQAVAYVASDRFSVAGDQRGTYQVRRAVRLTQTVDREGHVTAASYSGGITTVTVDCAVDSGLSSVEYGQAVENGPASALVEHEHANYVETRYGLGVLHLDCADHGIASLSQSDIHTGNYHIHTGHTPNSLPCNVNGVFLEEGRTGNGDYRVQTYTTWTGRRFVRAKASGQWRAWKEVVFLEDGDDRYRRKDQFLFGTSGKVFFSAEDATNHDYIRHDDGANTYHFCSDSDNHDGIGNARLKAYRFEGTAADSDKLEGKTLAEVLASAGGMTALKNENGWMKDKSTGMIIQWGRATVSVARYSSTGTFSFPIAFPSECLGLVGYNYKTPSREVLKSVKFVSRTQGVIGCSTDDQYSHTFYIGYIAIGY